MKKLNFNCVSVAIGGGTATQVRGKFLYQLVRHARLAEIFLGASHAKANRMSASAQILPKPVERIGPASTRLGARAYRSAHMREPFCPSQPTMGTVLNSMAGGPVGLIQVAQQQTHVFHSCPSLKRPLRCRSRPDHTQKAMHG